MLRKTIRFRLDRSRRLRVRRHLLMEQLGDRRVLATLTGLVFDDANQSLKQEQDEAGLASRLVYLDHNDNGSIDPGEPYQLTDEAGGFAFNEIAEGLAIVRVFDGSVSQRQTFPVEPESPAAVVAISGTTQLLVDSSGSVAISSDGVLPLDFEGTETNSVLGIGSLAKAQRLADGRLLVIGNNDQGETAWIVDTTDQSVTPIELSESGGTWSDVAIDGDGRGVLLQSTESGSVVLALDASDPEHIAATETSVLFAQGATVVSSASGPRSVIASPTETGLDLTLWSNTTATVISPEPIAIAGLSELIAFDDASGLLAARTVHGGVSVLDVDAQFAELHLFESLTGPIAIDGARELLVAVAPSESVLSLIDLADGSVIDEYSLSLAEVGAISGVAFGTSPDTLLIAGSAGVSRLVLRQPAAHRVTVSSDEDPASIAFGWVVSGGNTAPTYDQLPELITLEDAPLIAAAPGARAGSVDLDGDQWVVLQTSDAAHGKITVRPDGSLEYTPNDDFFGTDAFTVRLHDGRSLSDLIQLEITVVPVADPPDVIVIHVDPVPENIAIGDPVGTIEIIDVDLNNNHTILIDDDRFEIVGGQIIFIGDGLDFETEPLIPLTVTAIDPETATETVTHTTLHVRDENDPITGIVPTDVSVFENVAGELIAELSVLDQDAEQSHFLTVDDDRFVIDLFDLRLADGVSLDYETEPTVVVTVTATEFGTGGTFTQAIVIHVKDVPEQPTGLGLTNDTITEFVPGDEVGDVTVDGTVAPSRYALSVDDPRFEIDGSRLKLVDGQWVETAMQSEIQLQITATDTEGQFSPISETFVITVLEDDQPYHNDELPEDVDRNGSISASDALEIIHYLNVYGPGPVGQGDPGYGYDVNGDGQVTALDALLVINALNRLQIIQHGTVAGEPEEMAAPESLAGPQQLRPSESANARRETQHDQAITQFNTDGATRSKGSESDAGLSSRQEDERDLDAIVQDWVRSKGSPDDPTLTAAVDQFLRLLHGA